MATLPDLSTQTRQAPQPAGGVASYEPANVGRGVGQAISSAGHDIDAANEIIAATNDRQNTMSAQYGANQLSSRLISLQSDPKEGFASVKGSNAARPEFVTDYRAKFEAARDEVRASLPNDAARVMFDRHAAVSALHFKGALLQHQAIETNHFNKATEDSTIDLARRSIFENSNVPGAFDASVKQINWAIDQKAQREGWPAGTVAEVKQTYLGKIYEDVAGLAVEQDPRSALALLNKRIGGPGRAPENSGSPAVDSLDPQKLITLHHRAASMVAAEDAKKDHDEQVRDKEAQRAVDELQSFIATGAMPDQAYEARVRAATKGTDYEELANKQLARGMLGAAFGAQSLPRQQELLRQMEATNAQGASPEMLKLHEQVQTINRTQTKQYSENPWDAWTALGRGPQTPTADLGSVSAAQVVQQRVAQMTALETLTGFAVSPLKPEEAAKWADKLASLPPEARAAELGAVGAQLSAPRLAALAEQIDPKNKPLALALKLGNDSTNAGRNVSALVLKGAEALADKSIKRDDAALTGWRSEISALVRGSLGDAKAEQDVIDSAYYVRAAMDLPGISPSGFSLPTSASKAVQLVIGEPLERGGVKTFLPRDMDESKFDKALTDFAGRMRGTVYVRGQPVTAERFTDGVTRYGMKRDGRGNYVPSSGGAIVTVDQAGQVPLRIPVAP